jgi:hypothetical protein
MVRTSRASGIFVNVMWRLRKCNCGCAPCACKLILDVGKIFTELRERNERTEESKLHEELEARGMEPEFV